eukprot:205501-Amphidinium_carterae.1
MMWARALCLTAYKKKCKVDETTHAALEGFGMKLVRTGSFVGVICVRCYEEVENLGHIVFRCQQFQIRWMKYWANFANKVFHFWRLVGPLLRERLESEPWVRLLPEVPEKVSEVVIRHDTYLHCLDRGRQTGTVKGEYNFSYLKRQACRKLKKNQGETCWIFSAGGPEYRPPWSTFKNGVPAPF